MFRQEAGDLGIQLKHVWFIRMFRLRKCVFMFFRKTKIKYLLLCYNYADISRSRRPPPQKHLVTSYYSHAIGRFSQVLEWPYSFGLFGLNCVIFNIFGAVPGPGFRS